jgi:large subunit ribosomal protein L28
MARNDWSNSGPFAACGGNQLICQRIAMSRVCQVTGKRPSVGNNVSHANNKTKRRFLPNLHTHRFWLASEKRFVRLRVSTRGLRLIDKVGLEKVVADLRSRGEKV